MAKEQRPVRYELSGLETVWILNMDHWIDDTGEESCVIRNLPGLHRAIASAVIGNDRMMTGGELKFLRTELGLTQAELGQFLHKEPVTVSRWETGKEPINQMADTLVRLLAQQKLGIKPQMRVEDFAELSVPRTSQVAIWIDGSDPSQYVPMDEPPEELRAIA